MRTLSQVERQMREVEKEAEKKKTSSYTVRDLSGNFMMTPLLAAKAQLLHSLALINKKEFNN